ncbi:hypothetical protein ACH5BF_05645 [Arcobacter sp. YIC-464]|uniref:hypothetical protein n=1 Tax=Arcobacter sp. YIC-464 TaxID=3376631 RepID=UPI003C150055
MKLEYAGLKPVISEHGISFKDGKEDKFKYLKYAAELLEAFDHEYKRKTNYTHELKEQRLNANEILSLILKFHPNIEETMQTEIDSYLKHLDQEEIDVENRTSLTSIEKEAFVNNLKIMREYKIQRARNKIFYFHCIETIVELIIEHQIKQIEVPFNERFWHILQTLQGKLSEHKISSDVLTTNVNDTFKAILKVSIYPTL